MEAVASFFVLLSIIIGHSDFASGLQCKIGVSDSSAGENSTNTICDVGSQYCYALMCSAGPSVIIIWGCSAEQDKIACADETKNWMENRQGNALNFLCECKFGEKGKDLENAKFALPLVPTKVPSQQNTTTKNLLICKIGVFGENGYGATKLDNCLQEQHEYCFAASCVMINPLTNGVSAERTETERLNGTILLKKTCKSHLICYMSKMAKDSGNWKYGGRFRVNNPNKGLADKCAGNDGTKGWHGLKIIEESNGTVTFKSSFSNNLNGNLYYSLVSNGLKHLNINITKVNGQFVEEEFLKALRFGAFLRDYDGMAFRIAAMEMLRAIEEKKEKLCKKTEQAMKATPASSTVMCLVSYQDTKDVVVVCPDDKHSCFYIKCEKRRESETTRPLFDGFERKGCVGGKDKMAQCQKLRVAYMPYGYCSCFIGAKDVSMSNANIPADDKLIHLPALNEKSADVAEPDSQQSNYP